MQHSPHLLHFCFCLKYLLPPVQFPLPFLQEQNVFFLETKVGNLQHALMLFLLIALCHTRPGSFTISGKRFIVTRVFLPRKQRNEASFPWKVICRNAAVTTVKTWGVGWINYSENKYPNKVKQNMNYVLRSCKMQWNKTTFISFVATNNWYWYCRETISFASDVIEQLQKLSK